MWSEYDELDIRNEGEVPEEEDEDEDDAEIAEEKESGEKEPR